MTSEKAIKILERRTTIPDNDASWEDINKAIDIAVAAIRAQQGMLSINFSQISDADIQYIKDCMKDVPVQIYKNTICPPPNNPLTLEQLREMTGEPIFLETGWIATREQLIAKWEIFVEHVEDRFYFTRRAKGFLGKNYGKTWLAYRHNPTKPVG